MEKIKKCNIVFYFLGIMLLLCLPASAFDYTGSAWCCQDIVYCVNPTELSNVCGVNDRNFTQVINSAASTWSNYGSAFQLIYGGPTSNTGCGPDASSNCTGILDGQNVVSVASGCSFPAGVIATAWWWYTVNPGQNDNCCIFEADICFLDDASWYENSSETDCSLNCYDLESVALHEFGHWASLGHEDDYPLITPKPVMYSSFSFCEMRRTLTPDDMAGIDYIYSPTGVINAGMRCDPIHSHPPYAGSSKVPLMGLCEFTPCDGGCQGGQPFCDSIITDPCLVVCPASDIVFTVTVKDSCGDPVCDPSSIYLDFTNCPSQPCPNEEPNWPLVFPDSCNPNTGEHYFTVDAGTFDCIDCYVDLIVAGAVCQQIPVRFLDITGDLCVTWDDWIPTIGFCNDYDCNGLVDANDSLYFINHMGHCCGECPPGPPFCDSVITDTCLVICPASDIVYTVRLVDSCGNPICDPQGTWLDFSNCPAAIPCPNEEPDWPRVFPDSCNPNTGEHYFTVDAGYMDPAFYCDCEAQLFVNGQFCQLIPTRFLDITGDFCVTWDDWFGAVVGLLCNDYNCDGIVDVIDSLFFIAHMGHCCGECQHGVPFCDSVTADSCLLVCPASDIVYEVRIVDSCGLPVCDTLGTWLDFSNCPSQPCPNEEPNWPRVFPDSCDPNTGVHYFTVDAGALDCIDCLADLYVNSAYCQSIPTYFLDIDGDLCVTDADYPQPPWPCTDYNCNGFLDADDEAIHIAHLGHCCTDCQPGDIFCDSLIVDTCLLVCPLGDELFTITTVDSCGNPVCNPNGLWLDFSNCPTIPCGDHHPLWPTVYPDSCNPNTGEHFFSIYASAQDCIDCDVNIVVGGGIVCQTVPAKFFDIDGDGCVLQQDFFGGLPCADYNCNFASEIADSLIFMSHLTHCCTGPCADTLCTNGVISTAFQVAGTKDDFSGSEASSPGADLIPLLNCPQGMTNFFDSVITNQCFGHTFNDFWESKCCILDGQLCLKITATGAIPNTDYIVIAENGVQIWSLSLNELVSIVTGGNDTLWSLFDTLETCLDLDSLPPDGNGITNVLASLVDGDFDVKFQDDTEIDYLELRVTRCCPGCCIPLLRGNVDYDPQDQIDIADLVYFVDYSFGNPPGPAPPCLTEADVDGSGGLDIADIVYLVDYMFGTPSGPAPVDCY